MTIKLILLILLFSTVFSEPDSETTSMTGGLGSITRNGELYNQIALRPNIPIGKFFIGLDIYFNFNSNGEIFTSDYDFSSFKSGSRSILDKVRLIKYGNIEDDFHITLGNLNNITLGNGILVNNYSNSLEYPSKRKLGINIKFQLEKLGFQFICSDFKYDPGLVSLRSSYKIKSNFDIGISVAADMDQYAGLTNSDQDSYPDIYDHYPYDSYKWSEAEESRYSWRAIYDQYINSDIDFEDWFQNLPINHNDYDPDNTNKKSILGTSIDLNYKINKNLKLFSQVASLLPSRNSINFNGQKSEYGYGFVPLGVKYDFGNFRFLTEYRYNSNNFIFNYWDRSYEVNRVIVVSEGDSLKTRTKESSLIDYGKMSGFYAELNGSIANILFIKTSYTSMKGKRLINFENQKYNKSFSSVLSFNTQIIPKLTEANAFYQQNNVPNPLNFEFTESTIYGYNLGFQISNDLILFYKSSTNFIFNQEGEIEPINTILIETQFIF